jgi:hypothetical protein
MAVSVPRAAAGIALLDVRRLAPPCVRRSGIRRQVVLLGRGPEYATPDRLLGTVCAGRNAARVVRGEPGFGKTALLE